MKLNFLIWISLFIIWIPLHWQTERKTPLFLSNIFFQRLRLKFNAKSLLAYKRIYPCLKLVKIIIFGILTLMTLHKKDKSCWYSLIKKCFVFISSYFLEDSDNMLLFTFSKILFHIFYFLLVILERAVQRNLKSSC